jgi:hypothetical protein
VPDELLELSTLSVATPGRKDGDRPRDHSNRDPGPTSRAGWK